MANILLLVNIALAWLAAVATAQSYHDAPPQVSHRKELLPCARAAAERCRERPQGL
jgi:hypothetical protein